MGTHIAFLGTGVMGVGMAGRLLDAGHDLTVYNRTAAKADPLAAKGAVLAASPREAAVGANAIFAMVGDDDASRAVWTGPDGALAGECAEGAFAIECSTLSHDWVLELGRTAAGRGLRYLDCPVTGLPDTAADGRLTLLVGAAGPDLEAARDLLDPLCADIIHFGPVGAGTAYKLLVNLMGAVQIASAAEGLLIAEKAGLDASQVAAAIGRGAAASPQVIEKSRQMVEGEQGVTFAAKWRLKDIRYGLALARKLGQATPLGQAALAAFQKLIDQGLGEANESRVIDVLRS
jgi:3-hydroxyisobutyrate dehydrogenase